MEVRQLGAADELRSCIETFCCTSIALLPVQNELREPEKVWVAADWAVNFVTGGDCSGMDRLGVLLVTNGTVYAQADVLRAHLGMDLNQPGVRAGILAALSPDLCEEDVMPLGAREAPITETVKGVGRPQMLLPRRKGGRLAASATMGLDSSTLHRQTPSLSTAALSSGPGSLSSPPTKAQTSSGNAIVSLRRNASNADVLWEMDVELLRSDGGGTEPAAPRPALQAVPFRPLDSGKGFARFMSGHVRTQSLASRVAFATQALIASANTVALQLRSELRAVAEEKEAREDAFLHAFVSLLNEKKAKLRELREKITALKSTQTLALSAEPSSHKKASTATATTQASSAGGEAAVPATKRSRVAARSAKTAAVEPSEAYGPPESVAVGVGGERSSGEELTRPQGNNHADNLMDDLDQLLFD